MSIRNRLYNSIKDFEAFKPKNQSLLYDICLKIIHKNNNDILHKDEYIKQIKSLKTIHLNKSKKKIKLIGKRNPEQKTLLQSSKSIDEILKESKLKIKMEKENTKVVDEQLTKIEEKKKPEEEKEAKPNKNILKFFNGKQRRYTIYKHINEYLESNNITISELIQNNPFQSRPYFISGSHEFLEAVKFNNYELVQNMLEKNIKLLFSIDYFGQTAYHWAAKFSDIKMMKILISFGKHHNQKDFKGRTPIYLAAFYNNKDMCKFLLENNANLFLKDKENKSPADVTSNEELKHFLLEHMSHPFDNPVYKLKIKKILEEREINLSKNKKLSRSNSKFVGVAEQLFDINKYYI